MWWHSLTWIVYLFFIDFSSEYSKNSNVFPHFYKNLDKHQTLANINKEYFRTRNLCGCFNETDNRFGGLKGFFYFHFAYLINKFKNSKISLFQVTGNFYTQCSCLERRPIEPSIFEIYLIHSDCQNRNWDRNKNKFGTCENGKKEEEKHPKRAHCHLPTNDANNLLWVTHIPILNGFILIVLRNTICVCTLLSIQKKGHNPLQNYHSVW